VSPLSSQRLARPGRLLRLLSLGCCLAAAAGSARAQVTAFNYQGQLQTGGAPANGVFDVQFALYDSTNLPGNLLAGPTNAIVTVNNGLFSATLDFGPGVFTGEAVFLNLGVRTNGSQSGYTVLSPRQPFLPTPYAVMAGSASNLLGFLPATPLPGGR
jgi:hypothetical protein